MDLDEEVMARDVFPAEVLLPDGKFVRHCRVCVTSHRVIVYTLNGRKIELLHQLDLVETKSVTPDRASLSMNGRIEAETTQGKLHINRAKGCSCGPLAALGSPVPWTRRGAVKV
jgi:hypothetical protein